MTGWDGIVRCSLLERETTSPMMLPKKRREEGGLRRAAVSMLEASMKGKMIGGKQHEDGSQCHGSKSYLLIFSSPIHLFIFLE